MSICHSNRPRLRGLPRPTAVPQPPKHDPALVSLVRAARSGDHAAWTSLVRRFDRSLRTIARSYRLAPADIDDVVQATWQSMLEDIERVREPAAIAGWLATTTRRHAMRVLQKPARERLSDDPRLGERSVTDGPEEVLLAAERRDVLAAALATLPQRHRRLMTVLGHSVGRRLQPRQRTALHANREHWTHPRQGARPPVTQPPTGRPPRRLKRETATDI
jgi:RNA polymerase sigma factor (sigma-70 family)